MKWLFITISSIFFIGCSGTPKVITPKISKVTPTSLSWEDINHNGQKLHCMTKHEWDYVQSELIKKGMKANMCIDILDNYNK